MKSDARLIIGMIGEKLAFEFSEVTFLNAVGVNGVGEGSDVFEGFVSIFPAVHTSDGAVEVDDKKDVSELRATPKPVGEAVTAFDPRWADELGFAVDIGICSNIATELKKQLSRVVGLVSDPVERAAVGGGVFDLGLIAGEGELVVARFDDLGVVRERRLPAFFRRGWG